MSIFRSSTSDDNNLHTLHFANRYGSVPAGKKKQTDQSVNELLKEMQTPPPDEDEEAEKGPPNLTPSDIDLVIKSLQDYNNFET